MVATGFILDLWSKQLYWIEIYPPPLGKQILDILPYTSWIAGCLLIIDGLWRFFSTKKNTNLRFTSSIAVGILLTLCSLVYAQEILWPDFYHIKYGFPFAWLTRILSTIAGPVDYFEVNFSMLILDIIFWFGIILVTFWLWEKFQTRKRQNL